MIALLRQDVWHRAERLVQISFICFSFLLCESFTHSNVSARPTTSRLLAAYYTCDLANIFILDGLFMSLYLKKGFCWRNNAGTFFQWSYSCLRIICSAFVVLLFVLFYFDHFWLFLISFCAWFVLLHTLSVCCTVAMLPAACIAIRRQREWTLGKQSATQQCQKLEQCAFYIVIRYP